MSGIERIVVPIYIAVAFVAAGVMISTVLTPTVEVDAKPRYTVSSYSTKPMTLKLIEKIDSAVAEKLERVTAEKMGKSASSTNADFVALKDAVTASAKETRDLTTILPFRQLNQSGAFLDPRYRNSLVKQVEKTVDERIEGLEATVVALEAAVPGENAAIEAAEAEAARVAEEEASSGGGYYDGGYSGGGDLTSRIESAWAGLPFYLSYSIEGCPVGLACYTYTTHYIKVSPSIAGYSDCTLRNALAHEYRHYIQDISGWFAFDGNGQLTNRDWLESDAYAFGNQYGC